MTTTDEWLARLAPYGIVLRHPKKGNGPQAYFAHVPEQTNINAWGDTPAECLERLYKVLKHREKKP